MHLTYWCECMVLEKKNGSSNPSCAHSTPHMTLLVCNGNFWINVWSLLHWSLMYPFCNLASLLKWNKCEVCLSIIHPVKVPTSSQNAVFHQDLWHRFVNCSCFIGMHYAHLVDVLLLSGVEPASWKLHIFVIQFHRKPPAVAVLAFCIYIYDS